MATEAAGGQEKTAVFISYSRKDSTFAEDLLLALEGVGYEAYLDRHDIAPGEPWQDRLDGLILQADAVVFVISPNSIGSEICGWEVDRTVSYTKRLVPLVHQRVDGDIPDNLARLNWVFADSGLSADVVRAVRAAIDTDIAWERERTLWIARAERWRREGSSDGAVLRSGEIEAATSWLLRKPGNAEPLPEVIDALLHASREKEARDRRRTRRLQMGVGALLIVAALVLVAGAAGVLRVTQQQAERSADMLSRLSERAYEAGDYDLAARYAVAGLSGHDAFLLGFDGERLEANLAAALFENRLASIWRCGEAPFEAIAVDERRVAAVSRTAMACVWDAASGERLFELRLERNQSTSALAFSDDGARLLLNNGVTVAIFDTSDGRQLASIETADYSRDAALSPDGRTVAIAADRGPIRLHDATTGALVRTFEGHRSGIVDVEFSPDGARLLSASATIVTQSGGGDRSVRVWDVATGRQLAMTTHAGDLNEAHFSPDGERIASGGAGVRIWNARTGSLLGEMAGDRATFSPDGSTVMSVGADGVRMWRADDAYLHLGVHRSFKDAEWGAGGRWFGVATAGDSVVINSASGSDLSLRPQAQVMDAGFSPDGRRIFIAGEDGVVRSWELSFNSQPTTTTAPVQFISYSLPFEGGTRSLAFEPDGALAILDLEGSTPPLRMQGGAPGRGWPDLSRNGTRVSWTAHAGGVVRVWQARDGRSVGHFELDGLQAPNVTMDAEGVTLLGVGPSASRVWDVNTAEILLNVRAGTERLVAGGLSPDGRMVVRSRGDSVVVLDLRSGREIAVASGVGSVRRADFSPDSERLLLQTEEGVRYWRVAGHAGEMFRASAPAAAHSPDGTKVVGMVNDVMTVWDALSGRELFSRPDVQWSAWTYDGRYLAVSSARLSTTRIATLLHGRTGVMLAAREQSWMARPVFSGDGRTLFFVDGNQVTSWNVDALIGRDGRELVDRACNRMLARDDRRLFSAADLARAPVLDPEQDRDPCALASPWSRLASTLFPH